MKPFFFILFAFLLMACDSPEDPAIDKQLWAFSPQNNQENFDKALMPLLNSYQENVCLFNPIKNHKYSGRINDIFHLYESLYMLYEIFCIIFLR